MSTPVSPETPSPQPLPERPDLDHLRHQARDLHRAGGVSTLAAAFPPDKLARPEAEFALQEAAQMAASAPSCLLCYEADWQTCHRRRVADILAGRHGFALRHLAAARDKL